MRYKIEFTGSWGGMLTPGWRPAITGTLNQTRQSDDEASTFSTHDEAASVLENVIGPEVGDAQELGKVRFRIVEAD